MIITEVEKEPNKKVLIQRFTYKVVSIDYGKDTELDCPQIFELCFGTDARHPFKLVYRKVSFIHLSLIQSVNRLRNSQILFGRRF